MHPCRTDSYKLVSASPFGVFCLLSLQRGYETSLLYSSLRRDENCIRQRNGSSTTCFDSHARMSRGDWLKSALIGLWGLRLRQWFLWPLRNGLIARSDVLSTAVAVDAVVVLAGVVAAAVVGHVAYSRWWYSCSPSLGSFC